MIYVSKYLLINIWPIVNVNKADNKIKLTKFRENKLLIENFFVPSVVEVFFLLSFINNFNPSNIIVAEDGTPYILDWSHATQGNASADVARTYLLFNLVGDEYGAKKYLDTFCKKSDTAKQYVQKWMPIVAASQSVKGNEKEREFLLSWVDVVDYE